MTRQGVRATGTHLVAVVVLGLVAIAVFLPALRWIRRLVDRVLDHSQYGADRVLVLCGERIRTGADPLTAGVDLVGAVERTLPTAIALRVQEAAR